MTHLSCLLMMAALLSSRAVIAEPSQRFVRDGVAVDLSMAPVTGADALPRAGDHVEVRFRISNAETGTAMTGLNPIAWLDRSESKPAAGSCQSKIRSFLGGSLQARPEVDLNSYHIVVLNRGGSISVIDPLRGFGGSRLMALILLGGEGADWAVSPDRNTLFVSVPLLNEVVAVDTATWKIAARIAVGARPRRLAFQPDGGYLWVATSGLGDASGGMSVIDTTNRREAARIPGDSGDHEIAFSSDNRFAFATNRSSGTLSVYDIRKLREVSRLETGKSPNALGYSSLSQGIYAGHPDGTVVVIDASSHTIRKRIKTAAGLTALAFSPDGRAGFVISTEGGLVSVIDSSTDEVAQKIAVEKQPDQVSFTDGFAYIRSAASEHVTMIRLSTVDAGEEPDLTRFPGGQVAPEFASQPSVAASIVRAPGATSVLVANPADRIIYYYMEGMAAPMGNFQNYKREPMGVLAVNRNLREIQPGVYSTTFKAHRGGRFDVPFLIDSPKLTHCFDYTLTIANEPVEQKNVIRMERLSADTGTTQTPLQVRLRITDAGGSTLDDVPDLRLLAFTPGRHQKREWVQPIGNGIYEVTLIPPHSGIYYLFFESASLGKTYRALPRWVVRVADRPSGDTQ